MIRIDDSLLEELGLISLPKAERDQMLRQIYETLEMRVGMKLAERMSDQQLDEFERFIDTNDEAGALKWLETNFPDYKQVVADELEKLKVEIKRDAPQIMSAMQQVPAAVGQAPIAPNPTPMPQPTYQTPAPATYPTGQPYQQAPPAQQYPPQPVAPSTQQSPSPVAQPYSPTVSPTPAPVPDPSAAYTPAPNPSPQPMAQQDWQAPSTQPVTPTSQDDTGGSVPPPPAY